MKIGVGKFKGFMNISNELGQFQMLALDQRNSLISMIEKQKSKAIDGDLISVKRAILKNLSNNVTAVLIDGEYGFPNNLKYISNRTGIILSAEKSGYVSKEDDPKGRLSVLYRKNVGVYAKKVGANAVKLLVYWSDKSSDDIKEHQLNLVENLGKECLEEDILYILEIVTYDVEKVNKPQAILNAMRIFNDKKYGVDLFKVEPITITSDSSMTATDVYEASGGKPWVILSGGMDANKFKDVVKWNCRLGASGFLAGRVIWKEAPTYITNPELMDLHLKSTGMYNLELLKFNAMEAIPFYRVPYFNGIENIEITV